MPRIAILGSCITRDLWPVDGAASESLLYISRTSLPSLFAPPVSGFLARAEPPPPLGRHQHRAVVDDLSKRALAALIAHRPTHLIVDFIDERFDLLAIGGALATHSWELEVSGYLAQPALSRAQPISRLSEPCERLWRQGLAEFTAFVQATRLAEATIILHEAQWATHWTDSVGSPQLFGDNVEIWTGRPADVAQHNALLRSYQTAFREALPAAKSVAPTGARLADPGHRWGLSPFHYTAEYYDDIWGQLKALGV